MASNNFINECKEYANSNRLGKITIGNNEINQDNYLSEFEVNDGCFVNGSIIGSVYVKAFNGNFLELPDTIEIENKQLNVQAGVKFDDDTTEYVNLGNYDITTIKNSQTDIPTSIEAFDRLMNKLDKKYVCNIDFSTSKTIKDVYIDVCNNLGLTPVTTTFLNSDIEVVGNPFTENDTNRAVLQAICKVSCSYVELDESTGKIDLKWLSTSAEPDYLFNDGDDFSTLEGGITTFGPVNVVTIANSEVPSENVSMGTGDNEVVINEDYFLYNATLRQKAITNIYNRLKGLTYVDLKLTTYTGKPFIKVGSKIRVIYEGKTYDTYALIHTFKYDGTFTSIIESPALTKQETQIKNDVSLKEVIKNTQLIVNKQEGKINGLVTKTENLEKEVTTIKETSGNNSLYIEDALENKVLEYGIDGKSKQDGTPTPDTPVEIKSVEGIRNLFDKDLVPDYYFYTSTGTKQYGTADKFINQKIIPNSRNYVISFKNKYSTAYVRIVEFNSSDTFIKRTLFSTNNSTITLDENTAYFICSIDVGPNAYFEELQIEEGSIAHSIVPYGSWLKIQTTSKNLCNGINQNYYLNIAVNNSGVASSNSGLIIKVDGKSEYTISTKITQERFRIACLNVLPIGSTKVDAYNGVNKDGTSESIIIDTTGYKYLVVNATDLTQIQVEKGTKTDFEQYKENITLIDMNKPNLFDDELILGNLDNSGVINQAVTYRIASKNYISVEPNRIYSIINDKYETGVVVVNYDENKNFISRKSYGNGGKTQIIVTESNAKYIRFCSGGLVDNPANDTTTKYEIYEGVNNYYELCSTKDGSVTDTINIDDIGNVTLTKRIGSVVLNGGEYYTLGGSTSDYYEFKTSLTPNAISGYTFPISTHFSNQTNNRVVANRTILLIRVPTSVNITTPDEFKTWLSNNPVTVKYVLAEPYTIDLGQVDISLFENINHINLVDDIETNTRVKYLINNVMNGTYATKGELELTNEQFQTTITNEFNSLERQMTSITQTGGAIDLAIQSSKDYTDSKNESLDNRITNSENNYNDLNNKYNTLNGKITDMNFSFKTDGLTIGTSGSEINSKLDNKGLKIYNASTLIAIFNQNGSGFKKLIATESIQLQNLLIQKRVINTPKANNMEVISFFFNKSLIENLTDLESD